MYSQIFRASTDVCSVYHHLSLKTSVINTLVERGQRRLSYIDFLNGTPTLSVHFREDYYNPTAPMSHLCSAARESTLQTDRKNAGMHSSFREGLF